MSTKHTPGPWQLVFTGREREIVATASNETLMCDLDYYAWCPNEDADWKLIASAPDLLLALIAARWRIQIDRTEHPRYDDLLAQIDAAITKATGSTS